MTTGTAPAAATVENGPSATATARSAVGSLLRDWRLQRNLSQLQLASQADVSARHISFMETGRSSPSRDMLLHLSEELVIPLRERNAFLLAAGYAPVYSERSLDEPALVMPRAAIQQVLTAHEPNPVLAVDSRWNLVQANSAVSTLTAGIPDRMLTPSFNVRKLSLHPDGLASQIVNLDEWRAHVFARLRRQIAASRDPAVMHLLQELMSLPGGEDRTHSDNDHRVVVPLQLRVGGEVLSFFSTVTTFGTPLDVTLSELVIEASYPADERTAKLVRMQTSAPREGLSGGGE